MRCLAVAMVVVGTMSGPLLADEEIVGRPRVVDADTLEFSGRVLDLAGIDAPELEQTCRLADLAWPCGQEARWAVLNRIGRHWVTCVPRGRSSEGGAAAVCYLAGRGQMELNSWLVRHGWALAEPEGPQVYEEEEHAAQTEGAGLWRGAFIAPWDWRRGRRLPR